VRIAGNFEEHFLHFGFKKTTVDEVAAEMGISKKTIYKHFSSKEDIFYFIISRMAQGRKLLIEKKLIDINAAMERLEMMIRFNLTEFRKMLRTKEHAIQDRFQNEIAARAFRESFYEMLSDIIEEGVKKGEFSVCEHGITTRYVQALITETVNTIREDFNSNADDILICTLKKILIVKK
jgi:AcrR family transcriptional regulator